jgi:uncharacterized membrane protein
MSAIAKTALATTNHLVLPFEPAANIRLRVESIDLLRGLVMIVMALDHVRDYFHADAFVYSPTDLSRTSVLLFLTRWITHYCAPVFVFLAGVSAHLYGAKTSKKEVSVFLLTRGLWLVVVELVVLALLRTFNPAFEYFTLQVIWAIGIAMVVMSALVFMDRRVILVVGLVLMAGHNLLDDVHVPGDGVASFLWAVLHEPRLFVFGRFSIRVLYPLLPWIGTMAVGYCFGHLYTAGYSPEKRRRVLLLAGLGTIAFFVIARYGNWYGDAAQWAAREAPIFSVLSFLNVTKYPPSLFYLSMTLGPALVFLALTERAPKALTARINAFGRVPMFYYLAHFLLIHLGATVAAVMSGYEATDMVLTSAVNDAPALRDYGFGLPTVYLVWLALVLVLYPCCKWYDGYKRRHQATQWWLSYL